MPDKKADKLVTNLTRFLFAGVGIVLVIIAVVSGISTRRFIARSAMAEGSVIKLNAGGSHPEIKFTTGDGREIEYPQNGLIGGYQTGDKVTVLYDPEDPHQCELNSSGALWGVTISMAIGGVIFIGVAGLMKSRQTQFPAT